MKETVKGGGRTFEIIGSCKHSTARGTNEEFLGSVAMRGLQRALGMQNDSPCRQGLMDRRRYGGGKGQNNGKRLSILYTLELVSAAYNPLVLTGSMISVQPVEWLGVQENKQTAIVLDPGLGTQRDQVRPCMETSDTVP